MSFPAHGTTGWDTQNNANFSAIDTFLGTLGVNVKGYPYYAAGNGVTDDTAAFNAALTAANLAGTFLFVPPGTYLLSSTLAIPANVNGVPVPIIGAGPHQTILLTTITNGSGVLSLPWSQFARLENFAIQPNSGSLQNAVGIYTPATSGNNGFNRYFISDVFIYALATGASLNGWIPEIQGYYTSGCTNGLILNQANGGRVHCNIEQGTTGLQVLASSGLTISGCIEGQAGTSLVIDKGSNAIAVDSYHEGTGTGIYIGLTSGSANTCANIDIRGAVASSTVGIVCDNVNGVRVGKGTLMSGTLSTTANARNVEWSTLPTEHVDSTSPYTSHYYPCHNDVAGGLRKAFNFFPNPYMRGGVFKGFGYVANTNVIPSIDTTYTRNGDSALRLTCAAGSGNASQVNLPAAAVNVLKGKYITIAAWIFISNTSNYTNKILYPDIYAYDGTTSTANNGQGDWTPGAWNLFVKRMQVNASASNIYIYLAPNHSGVTASTSDFCTFGEVMVFQEPVDMAKIYSGAWEISPLVGRYEGNNWIQYANSIPSDANQTFTPGDGVINTAPVAGGVYEWICTTGGTGATAVWKTLTLGS
jgi:hypothetical protein